MSEIWSKPRAAAPRRVGQVNNARVLANLHVSQSPQDESVVIAHLISVQVIGTRVSSLDINTCDERSVMTDLERALLVRSTIFM